MEALIVVGLIAVLVAFQIFRKKRWQRAMEPFFAVLKEEGYFFSINKFTRWGSISADDTLIFFCANDMRNDKSFGGYFYTGYIGGCQICLYINNPCSEHNQNELEIVIQILKATI